MTQPRFLSLVFAAALLLGGSGAALADGRGDWKGYDWQRVDLDTCPTLGAGNPCQIFHGKWDWKRNQWVDLMLTYTGSALELVNILTNYDRADDDYVCTVVLFVSSEGRNLAAFHFNEHSDHQTAANFTSRFPISRAALAQTTTVDVGTKQCREGGNQDKGTYARVVEAIRQN
ncbi:hypothetical protein VW35_12855 [Devosia soli]|uniref:Uncharacterized protein n=1 Tax=Devosia soli TaxID=361041 RepID=A0A0F5L8N8_9HYPH|nr:hypothetical protein [Devosia soli]KKB78002.1 hypothetical protein VW35_12855 [Devosia soli]